MLQFLNVTKWYGYKRALENVSCNFEKGKVYALVGQNGSGKSTLMKAAAGLVKPNAGKILYNEQPIGRYSKSKIAYMSTEPFYFDYMKIKDVCSFYQDFYDDFHAERFVELIKFMNLQLDMKVRTLSSGMMAKLKIVATLSRKAEVYMLDEPLNGIDLIGREQIIHTILQTVSPDCAMIISSHLLDELEPIVNYIVMMNEGIIALQGDAETLRQQHGKSLVEIYKDMFRYSNTYQSQNGGYPQW